MGLYRDYKQSVNYKQSLVTLFSNNFTQKEPWWHGLTFIKSQMEYLC